MNDDAAFVEAILASPDDNTLRLVYADWLDERNDPRGQLIRAWYPFLDACLEFQCRSPLPETEEFERCRAAVLRYQELAQVVDREWLWRVGASRNWVASRNEQKRAVAVTMRWMTEEL